MKHIIIKSNARHSYKPLIRISLTGNIYINPMAARLLGVGPGEEILFSEEEGQFYISKSNGPQGYKLHKGQTQFYNKGLVMYLTQAMDLALGEGKKKSIRLDVEITPLERKDGKYFKIY